MQYEIEGQQYPVLIERKVTNRNTYLRVKSDLTIYVTTNFYTKESVILSFIQKNERGIKKMIARQKAKNNEKLSFLFLGKTYDVVYWNRPETLLGENKILTNYATDLEVWYKTQARTLFQEHFDKIYQNFSRKIPYPKMRIRKMTSRWGVCNTKDHIVTLNLELIKRDSKYLDYVIVHELSHLVYPDHSSAFWSVVGENIPEYKKLRKEMKEF